MIQVLLVEDSNITRQALKDCLESSPDYMIRESINSAANAELVCMGGGIDLVLMDVCTAFDESGLEAAAAIKRSYPRIKVLIMTSMPECSFIRKARESGCDGFWYKEDGEEDILSACDRLMEGKSVWPEETPVIRVGNARSTEFTEQELEVLRALAKGYKHEEIAERLCISVNTLKYHVRNLLQKTGYRSTLQLVVDAVDKKLILPRY